MTGGRWPLGRLPDLPAALVNTRASGRGHALPCTFFHWTVGVERPVWVRLRKLIFRLAATHTSRYGQFFLQPLPSLYLNRWALFNALKCEHLSSSSRSSASALLGYGFYLKRKLDPLLSAPGVTLVPTPFALDSQVGSIRHVELGFAHFDVPASVRGDPVRGDDSLFVALADGEPPFSVTIGPPVHQVSEEITMLLAKFNEVSKDGRKGSGLGAWGCDCSSNQGNLRC